MLGKVAGLYISVGGLDNETTTNEDGTAHNEVDDVCYLNELIEKEDMFSPLQITMPQKNSNKTKQILHSTNHHDNTTINLMKHGDFIHELTENLNYVGGSQNCKENQDVNTSLDFELPPGMIRYVNRLYMMYITVFFGYI